MEFRLASAAFIAVFAAYLFLGGMGATDLGNPEPRDAAYNLLARGLLRGHLYLDREAPPSLARLADPYDPAANRFARVGPAGPLHDFSYYHGRLYLYYGVAPALFVFIPWHLLTGGWLPHWAAAVFLCSAGVLVNLSLVRAIRLGMFPGAPAWMTAVSVLILGLGSYAPVFLARADMWEVPIAFSYLAVSVALRCLWEAFERPGRPARWIALASAAFGAAFAARPTILPNAAILLVPLISKETRGNVRAWAAAVLPLAACGVGVGLYNALRFGSPFDFGVRYMLAGDEVARLHFFSPGFLWTDLRFNLLQGVHWSRVFPFAHEPANLAAPPDYGGTEHISGALVNAPILWAALALPLFIRLRRPGRSLALMAACAAWVALTSLALFSFFYFAVARYQFEFVPALALLASVGVMAMDALPAGRLRVAARCAWAAAVLFSCAFTVLYGIDRCASDHGKAGVACMLEGDFRGARHEFGIALFLSPGDPPSRLGTGVLLFTEHRFEEAGRTFEALVRDCPEDTQARLALGNLLAAEGRLDGAVVQYRAVLRLEPGDEDVRRRLEAALKGLN